MNRSTLWQKATAAVDADGVVELARGALRIPSLSGEEKTVAQYYVDAMRRVGMEADLQPVPATEHMPVPSYNAIGRLKGAGGGQSLMFNGHIDHNPVCEGWTRDPFGGAVENGWLYGFVHMKAANACYVMAVDAVKRAGIPLRGDLSIAHVCGELRGGAGTIHALKNGLTADWFVLGEPTELELAMNHTASLVAHVRVLGRMKHFATVDAPGMRGVNAVEKMMKFIPLLGRSHTLIKSRDEGGWMTFKPAIGFEGLPQLNIGPLKAGIGRDYNDTRPALLPDNCTLTIDFRIVPGQTKETITADLRRLLDGLAAADEDFRYEIEWKQDTFPLPFEAPRNSDIVTAVADAHAHVLGQVPTESKVLKFAASDASWMAAAGITGIIYGPTGRFLSRPDERCETQQLVDVTKVYACIIADICNRDAR